MTIDGSLPEQIEAAVAFVGRNIRQDWDRTGIQRLERGELPLAAVREAVANAVARRDYRSTAPTQLVLTDQALTVWNPGHLPAPLTPAALRREHPSVPPNPLIARALYLAGYIEEWGTGTTRVIELLETAGHPTPTFEEADGGIRARLPLRGGAPLLTLRQQALVAALATSNATRQLAARLELSVRTVQHELGALEDLGLVRREGEGRATRWVRTAD